MRRREFITLLGSMATGWPLTARAQQQGERVRLVCDLEGISVNTPNAKERHSAFLERLQQLGWTPGRNVRMEVRWGEGDDAAIRKYAAETRGDVRHRKDVFDAAHLDGGYDGRAAELAFGFGPCRAGAHPGSPSCRSMPTAVNLSLDWIVTRSKKPTLLRGRSQRREAADVLRRT
jgi:hypothetical protein